MACFIDSMDIYKSGGVGFVDPKTQRGGSQSFHTNIVVENGETSYVSPLAEKANATKWTNIA